jgi:hypothetical protein
MGYKKVPQSSFHLPSNILYIQVTLNQRWRSSSLLLLMIGRIVKFEKLMRSEVLLFAKGMSS